VPARGFRKVAAPATKPWLPVAVGAGVLSRGQQPATTPIRAWPTNDAANAVAQSAHHILAFFRSLQTERKARAAGAAVDAGLAVTRSAWLICTTVMLAWVSRSLAWALRGLLR
jgi:hypothetical protein